MPSIQDSIQIHQQLIAEGKSTPVSPETLRPPDTPPGREGTGIPGPVRGSYTPNQVLGTDFVRANVIGGPMRSGTFPVPPNNTNNTAAVRAALQAAAKASEAVGTINATIASLNNANVVTTAGPGGALQSGPISIGGGRGPISTLPIAPGRQRINQDQMSLDGARFVRLASTHAAANVSYNFQGTWSSSVSYVIADEVTFDNIYWIALVNNTNSQPIIGNSNWQAVGRIEGDVQVFTSSGTWTKPAAGTFAVITTIGAGAGGFNGGAGTGNQNGGNGGFAGGISTQILPLSVLGSTESVVVGTGGGAGGVTGGNSSFGNWLIATGGTSSAVGTGNMTGGSLSMLGGRGGSGGSAVDTTGTFGPGATGSSGATARNVPYSGGAGGVTIGASGSTGTNASTDEPAGGGGGGGGAGNVNISGGAVTGGAGGVGGNYGAGGGGGGAASTTGSATAGPGGAGAPGLVVIAVY